MDSHGIELPLSDHDNLVVRLQGSHSKETLSWTANRKHPLLTLVFLTDRPDFNLDEFSHICVHVQLGLAFLLTRTVRALIGVFVPVEREIDAIVQLLGTLVVIEHLCTHSNLKVL